jgi:hypothetical protein
VFCRQQPEKYISLAVVLNRVATLLLGIIIESRKTYCMQSKSLLIAIAAFAVTTSGVFAYSGDNVLERANLSEEQKTAITRAREFKQSGDLDAARDSLVQAGIDDEVLKKLHEARYQVELEMRAALVAGDYEAFIASISETPLADLITSEADFKQFKSAHELKDEGNDFQAHEILQELGVDSPKYRHGYGKRQIINQLSDEQKSAFVAAKQAGDKSTMQAIFDEAGINRSVR